MLGTEKQLSAHYAMLCAQFSGVGFHRPEDAFQLFFQCFTPVGESGLMSQRQRKLSRRLVALLD